MTFTVVSVTLFWLFNFENSIFPLIFPSPINDSCIAFNPTTAADAEKASDVINKGDKISFCVVNQFSVRKETNANG